MHSIRFLIALAVFAIPSDKVSAKEPKGACEAGWSLATPTTKRVCYRISKVAVDPYLNQTTVMGELRSAKSYRFVLLGIALCKSGKVACKASEPVNELEKGETVVFKGTCDARYPEPEKITVRVDGSM
jgi:hypothetical protein